MLSSSFNHLIVFGSLRQGQGKALIVGVIFVNKGHFDFVVNVSEVIPTSRQPKKKKIKKLMFFILKIGKIHVKCTASILQRYLVALDNIKVDFFFP